MLKDVDSPEGFPFTLFDQGTFTAPDAVLQRAGQADAWDSWGVRDVAILSDVHGNFVRDDDRLVMYYTGSCELGQRQSVGRAVSSDDGLTWQRDPEQPVLAPRAGQWDSGLATTAWVVKVDDEYRMYYRGAQAVCVGEAIGLAVSHDGVHFERHGNEPILTPADFAGMSQAPALMGVTHCVQSHDGDFLLMFEAKEKDVEQRGQIFAARSQDGLTFTPLNHGYPVFTARNIFSWPVKAVCNPRLVPLPHGWYLLGFNGAWHGEFAIGVAFTRDFQTWYEHPRNPMLVPRGWPPSDPFTYRLEGPVFDRDALLSGDRDVPCYLMSIPTGARNHQGAVNGRCCWRLGEENVLGSELATLYRALPVNTDSVHLDNTSLHINSLSEPSQFIQVHCITPQPLQAARWSVQTLAWQPQGYILLAVDVGLNSLTQSSAWLFKISPDGIFRVSEQRTWLVTRALRWLHRSLTGQPRSRLPPKQHENWQRCTSLPTVPFTVGLSCVGGEHLQLSVADFHASVTWPWSDGAPRVVAIAAYRATCRVSLDWQAC